MRLPRKVKKKNKKAISALALIKAMGKLPKFGGYDVIIDPNQDILKEGKIKLRIIPPRWPEDVKISH